MTLFKKLMISSILMVSFAVAVSTTLAITGQTRILSDELIGKGKLIAKQVALSTEAAFRSTILWPSVESAVQNAASTEDVMFCKVVMSDGTVYIADDRKYYGEPIELDVLNAESSLIEDYVDPRTGRQGTLIIEPIEIGQETWWVLLAVSSESVNKAARSVLLSNLLAAIAIMIPTTVGALVLSKGISDPITELANAAKALAAGRLDTPIDTRATGEVGVLVRSFNTMTGQLRYLIGSLEQRVTERTAELERRAVHLTTAAEVSRAASGTLDIEELLSQTVELIADRFNLYYAGLFLVDEASRWAVLQAATGEAGRQMLAQGHRLEVGGVSMVGWCTANAQARVALDVGEEAVRFDNPLLPDTRSEMALPLISRGRVIGALDVQSTQEAAFTDEDIAVLQTMADQLANAVENARLFRQTQESLEAERRAYGKLSREVWRELLRARPDLGQCYDPQGILPTDGRWREEMKLAMQKGETILGQDRPSPTLATPIKIRDQIIGVLDAHKPIGADEWTPEQVALLETLTEQLGLALESARLYQDTQRRAARERLTSQATARMRETLDVETVLKTAVNEMYQALGLDEIVIRLITEEDGQLEPD